MAKCLENVTETNWWLRHPLLLRELPAFGKWVDHSRFYPLSEMSGKEWRQERKQTSSGVIIGTVCPSKAYELFTQQILKRASQVTKDVGEGMISNTVVATLLQEGFAAGPGLALSSRYHFHFI